MTSDLIFHTNAAQRLWVAVIEQAIHDLTLDRYRKDAERFLMTSESDHIFEVAGINAKAARERIKLRIL